MPNPILNTDPETVRMIAQARTKMIEGTMTRAEWQAAIRLLRQNRLTAAAKDVKQGKGKGPGRDADSILSDLGI
jgi:hypothetical protein